MAAVKRYLGIGFAYNQSPPLSRYPLENFLFSTKAGYCQQFSGTMALLLRMGGVPARVASGFTAGVYDTSTHRWVVSDIDAHAWVEVWYPGYGWVRSDPTPATAPARAGTSAPPILKPSGAGAKAAATIPHREIGGAGTTRAAAGAHHGGGLTLWLVVPVAVLLLILGLPLVRIVIASTASADLLTELERALVRTRRPVPDGVTLVALEHRLATAPDAAAYVRALRLARYGGGARPPTATQRRALRDELARGLGLRGAIRAFWALPPWLPARHHRPS